MAICGADRVSERLRGDHTGYGAVVLAGYLVIAVRDPSRTEHRATFPRHGSRPGTRAQGSVP